MTSPDQLGGVMPGPDMPQAPDMWPSVDQDAVRAAEEAAEAEGRREYLAAGGAFAELVAADGNQDQQAAQDQTAPEDVVDPVTLAATTEYLAAKPTRDLLRFMKDRREAKERRLAEELEAEQERVRRNNLGLKDDEPLPPLPSDEDDGAIAFKGRWSGRTGLSRGNDRKVFAAEGLNPDGTEPANEEQASDESVAA